MLQMTITTLFSPSTPKSFYLWKTTELEAGYRRHQDVELYLGEIVYDSLGKVSAELERKRPVKCQTPTSTAPKKKSKSINVKAVRYETLHALKTKRKLNIVYNLTKDKSE